MYGKNPDNMNSRSPARPKSSDLASQRNIAKIGMALSLGTLVYTGFRGKEAAPLHIGAGLALVGFSFWHYHLYQPSARKKGNRQ